MSDRTERESAAAERFPMGTLVRFADSTATVSDGSTVMASGMVNGAPLEGEHGTVYVPVFTSRDGQREATTVYVAEPNIASAQRPS